MTPDDPTSSSPDRATVTRFAELTARLSESEQRFRGLFEFAGIGMALVAPDGRWLRVNPSLCQIVGYSADELLATTFQAITHPDDLDEDLAYARRLIRGDIQTYQLEKRYFRREGRVVWVWLSVALVRADDGVPLYFISQIQDITSRKEAELRLKASELRYRTIGDLVAGCLYEAVLDNAGMTLTWASSGFHRIFGCTVELFNQLGRAQFYEPAALAIVNSAFSDLRAGRDVSFEVPIRALDGRSRWIRFGAREVRMGGRGHDRVVGVVEDITEAKRLECLLRDASHAEQRRLGAELHDGLGQVLSGLAYLTGALANRAAQTGSTMAGQLSELADLASSAVATCRNIARGVSPLTETQGSLVEGLRSIVSRAGLQSRQLVDFYSRDSCPVLLPQETQDELFRIGQEALANALRHSAARRIVVTIEVARAAIRIQVADDGIGFNPILARTAGLGLSSMKHRAATIGAHLVIEARPGGGTLVSCDCDQPRYEPTDSTIG